MIGSDQVADLDGSGIGKPGDHARATAQLRAMRGRTVVFQTARRGRLPRDRLRRVGARAGRGALPRRSSDAEIERYLRAEQPYDCAGSAKSETLGIALLEAIESDDPTALIGLPLIRTCALLRRAGIDPLGAAAPRLAHDARRARSTWCRTPSTSARGEPAPTRRRAAARHARASPRGLDALGRARTRRRRAPSSSASTRSCPLAQPLQQIAIVELPRAAARAAPRRRRRRCRRPARAGRSPATTSA